MTSKHTPTPWFPGKIKFATNDGQVVIMAANPEDGPGCRKRVALVDCQSHFKRGKGYEAECAERDANLAFILCAVNAHDDLVALAEQIAHHFDGTDAPMGKEARALIARVRGE